MSSLLALLGDDGHDGILESEAIEGESCSERTE